MPKKRARRVPRAATPRMYGDTPPPGAKPVGATSQPAAVASSIPSRASTADARTVSAVVRPSMPMSVEYKYVMGDLRRLGITALCFFAVLIAAGVAAYLLQR